MTEHRPLLGGQGLDHEAALTSTLLRQFALQVQNLPVGCVVFDGEHRVRLWNAAAARLFGFSASEVVGRRPWGFFLPTDVRHAVQARHARLAKTRSSAIAISAAVDAQGDRIDCEWMECPLVAEDGQVVGVLSIVQDVSERVRAQRHVSRRERRLTAMLHNANVGIGDLGLDGRWLYVNERACELLGRREDELLDTDAAGFLTGLDDSNPATTETRYDRSDGASRWLRITSSLVRDDLGRPERHCLVLVDVTEHREDRLRLEHARSEAEALNRVVLGLQAAEDLHAALGEALSTACEALQATVAFVAFEKAGGWAIERVSGTLPPWLEGNWVSSSSPQIPLPTRPPDSVMTEERMDHGEHAHVLWLPLTTLGQSAGVVGFVRHQGDPFDLTDLDFGVKLSAALSLAFDNVRLRMARERELALSDSLARIGAAVNSTLETDGIMRKLMVVASDTLGAETAAVYLRERGRWVVRYAYRWHQDIVGRMLSDDELPHAVQAAETLEPVAVLDPTGQERGLAPGAGQPVRSMLVLPLVKRGMCIGAMLFNFHTMRHDFDRSEMFFARKLGASVSLALGNAELLAERSEAERLSRALGEVDLLMASTMDRDDIMRIVVRAAVDTLGCAVAEVALRGGGWWIARHDDDGVREHLEHSMLNDETPFYTLMAAQRDPDGRPVVIGDVAELPDLSREKLPPGTRSLIDVEMVVRERVLGVLLLSDRRRDFFGESHVDFASKLSASAAFALENARLYDAQHRIADTLQEALLTLPRKIEGLRFAHAYRSATESARVGGDFYDVFPVDDETVALLMGDVSGKGLEAAALTSVVKNTVRAHALEKRSPARIIDAVSEILRHTIPDHTFVTAFFGFLDLADGHLRYCDAGHPPPVVLTSDGRMMNLVVNSPLVGVWPELRYVNSETVIAADDVLLAYTDGLTEARSDHDMYGDTRLWTMLQGLAERSPVGIVEAVYEDVMRYTCGRLSDDVALLAVGLDDAGWTHQRAIQGRLEIPF